jgi:hypothetical protein
MFKFVPVSLLVLTVSMSTSATAGPIVFSVGGDTTTASIQATVDAFRAALGDPLNGNAAGPLADGRREINWDGGGSTATSPGGTPFNTFLNTRGAQFTTPGTGFLQAPEAGGLNGGLATFFGNTTYDASFNAFSPTRLFVPVGSNVTDTEFFIPGTNGLDEAVVNGFGAVFTDVDLAGASRMEFFDRHDNLLGSFDVPTGTVPDGSLSFLGVLFDGGEEIGRVRIIGGNTPLGPNDDPANGVDIVALDDFLFSEPAIPTPEPSSGVLLGAGALAFFVAARRRRGRKLSVLAA